MILNIRTDRPGKTVKEQSDQGLYEPAHEIVLLFILRKLILQMHMGSHPVGVHV